MIAPYLYLFNRSSYDYIRDLMGYVTGYKQYKNTERSVNAQIDYNEYLKRGNERAYADWQKNVGWQRNTSIKYPEFSYPGQIYQLNTGTARSMYDRDNAYGNFVGNVGYRTAGLYGIGSKLSRWI